MKTDRWTQLLDDKVFRAFEKTSSPNDYRDPFEKDYWKLIASAPIRRLQDKTQVFPLEKSDFIRTRLTHSLEVSALARSMGKSIEQLLIKKGRLDSSKIGHISSLLATAGLVHDLGNPPFGHFGEDAIKHFFVEYFNKEENKKGWTEQQMADFRNFDGNVQTFRVLRKLYFFRDEHGYNLTFPTLACIIKYPRSSVDGNKGKGESATTDIAEKKFGFFASEEADYKTIDNHLGLKGQRHPLTFLLEAADDIAYSAADIEDGVKLGILNFDLIRSVFEEELNKYDEVHKALLNDLNKFYEEFKSFPYDRLGLTVQRFRGASQGAMVSSVIQEFILNYDDIMDGVYKHELLEKCSMAKIKSAFKKLSLYVYKSKDIMETELAGWKLIHGLLEEFIAAAKTDKFKNDGNAKENRLYSMISSSYCYMHERFNTYNINPEYSKFQLVTDFISGMTDSYALNLYQRLTGIK